MPFFPWRKGRELHKGFKDPALVKGPDNVKLAAFREVRDEIKTWLTDHFIDSVE